MQKKEPSNKSAIAIFILLFFLPVHAAASPVPIESQYDLHFLLGQFKVKHLEQLSSSWVRFRARKAKSTKKKVFSLKSKI